MTNVVFGRGERAGLATAFEAGTPVLIVATPGRVAMLDATLSDLDAAWRRCATFIDVPQHVPKETLEAAAALADEHGVSGAVAFGGGSAIGVVKALALRRSLRKVYVPTTYSGSEMTNIWAVSADGQKTTGRDDRARADLVIYDPDVVDSMPLPLVFVSLFNALAHAVEAMYAPDVTPEVIEDASSSVRLLADAISTLSNHDDRIAREAALRGAYHAGRALDAAQMGLHHKLAHVLGGTLALPHSPVHTVLLPHSLAYNRGHAAEAMRRLEPELSGDPVAVIERLRRDAMAPTALRDLGMAESDIDRVVDEVFVRPYPNPRPLERAPLRALVRAAWNGDAATLH